MSPQGVAGTATVTKIRGRHAVFPVYNLTVEGTSRYLVGACGVVVHNTNGCGADGTVGALRAAGKKDAHHVIQDAAVRDLPGYNSNAAPGVQLQGPSTTVGTPHNLATAVQREAGGGTYGAERRIGYRALRKAGFSRAQSRDAIRRADDYFRSLGVGPATITRIPGNR
jgi:hypothetical protein